MPPRHPLLHELMLRGARNGLRWETKGHKEIDANGNVVHVHHNLIHHPHSVHIAKTLFRGVGSKSKMAIGAWLAAIYDLAADNVHLCGVMEPEAFFAYAKNSWAGSAQFKDEAFWAFTYKLFHARALYLDSVNSNQFQANPLTEALDRFHDQFYDRYDPDAVFARDSGSIWLKKRSRTSKTNISWSDRLGRRTSSILGLIAKATEVIAPFLRLCTTRASTQSWQSTLRPQDFKTRPLGRWQASTTILAPEPLVTVTKTRTKRSRRLSRKPRRRKN
ncbi:hypothetical protein HD806DRAFT_506960 [Xylariaceae sp. AK1471]|nr:hypothetical protein HD806DRAFT_506960 [Xylariaceae sp. AK1471]